MARTKEWPWDSEPVDRILHSVVALTSKICTRNKQAEAFCDRESSREASLGELYEACRLNSCLSGNLRPWST